VGAQTTVFGLDVTADRDLSFLLTATAPPTGRTLSVSVSEDGKVPSWPGGKLISDQRLPGGDVNFQIESGEEGYRIWSPEYGTHLLAADGSRIWGAASAGRFDAWQRMLVAQTLPFAAVLQGLEVLHASAVARDGAAIAIAGVSGSGKTSLARALVERGAEFLTDDVLALERRDGELLAHPGAPVAGIGRHGAGEANESRGREVVAVNDREWVERVALSPAPAPLSALIMVERSPDGPSKPRFEPVSDPRMLLSATFNLLLATPERLEGLLDVCARLAAAGAERVQIGSEVEVEDLADALAARVEAPA
jgi:hypothetical protein